MVDTTVVLKNQNLHKSFILTWKMLFPVYTARVTAVVDWSHCLLGRTPTAFQQLMAKGDTHFLLQEARHDIQAEQHIWVWCRWPGANYRITNQSATCLCTIIHLTHVLNLCEETEKDIFAFSTISQQWNGTWTWNPSLWKTRAHFSCIHYNDVIMGMIVSQITSLTIVYSTVYSDADQRKHQSSASLAFVPPGEFTGDRWIPCTNGQ